MAMQVERDAGEVRLDTVQATGMRRAVNPGSSTTFVASSKPSDKV